MNDAEVLDQVRDALRDALLDARMELPLDAVVARGRARRRRRRGLAACAVAGVLLVGTVVGVERTQSRPAASSPATARLAAFTLSATPGGETALTLRKGAQYRLDPGALRQALADHGIAAVVTVGETCDTASEPGGLDEVVSARRDPDGAVYLTINPAAMPAGSELSIGYYATGTSFGLIESAAPLHCASHPPSGRGRGSEPRAVGSN